MASIGTEQSDSQYEKGTLVRVWVASLDECDQRWSRHLDSADMQRWSGYSRATDRDRFLLGRSLVRAAIADALAVPIDGVRLTATCGRCGRPHGRVRTIGTDLGISVSHSGQYVLVALMPYGSVGVDVEALSSVEPETVALTLTAAEQRTLATLPPEAFASGFARYWTRKEAVLKFTGDGLAVPPTSIEVSPPFDYPRLVAWTERPDMVAELQLADLDLDKDHAACVAFPQWAVGVELRRARELLGALA